MPRKVAAFMAAHPPPPIELWKCNQRTLELFEALGGQWRTGLNGPTGLDNAAIRPTAELLDIALTREMFQDIRAMAHAVLMDLRKGQ